jgi:hypothetical protein
MAHIILPRRFYSQPQGAVEVNWGSELVQAARFVYVTHPADGRIIHDYKFGRVITNVQARTATPLGLRASSPSYTTQTIDIGPGVIGNSRSHFSLGTVNNTTAVPLILHATSAITPVSGGVKYTARSLDGYFNTATVSCDGVQPVWGVWDHPNNLATCHVGPLSASIATTNSWAGYVANRVTIDGHVNSGFLLNAVAEGVVDEHLRVAISANPWQIFRAKPRVLYFDVGGGATIIDLTSASFGFTAYAPQNTLRGSLTAALFTTTPQDTQNRQTITPTAPSLSFTANTIQNRLSATLTAATLSFTAQAINVVEGAATFVIDLTAATFAYTAQSVQLAQSMAMSAASLVMTAGAVAMTQAVSLTAATLSFVGQATQNRLTIGLAAAAIGFTAWALDVTGAIASAAARLMMLMGVGS